MFFHQRFIPGLAIYSYMVGDERTREAAVIDPTRDVTPFIEMAKAEGLRITHIMETHVHADFISGANELKQRLGGEPRIHCSGLGGAEWTPPYADHIATDGHEIKMGKVKIKGIHTPGHTYEHMIWALYDESRSADIPWLLFTGDFVFVGDVGRPDLLGEEARKKLAHQLYGSVFSKLPPFEDFTEIFPGHGAGSLCGKAIGSRASSTLGFERRFNPALKSDSEEAWIQTLLKGMPIAPPYFRRMKKVNAAGAAILGLDPPGKKRFSAKEVHQRVCEHCIILDTRGKEAFAAGHIPNSINIPFGANLPTWAGWVLPYDTPMLIVPESPETLEQTLTDLLRVGFDDVRGYLEDGLLSWENAGYELATIETISVHELDRRLRLEGDSRPFILDVRTDREWEAGHIEGACHIHGGLLQDHISRVPQDRPVAVVCGTGYRASIAASFLKREGRVRVSNVLGGMSAWVGAGLPTL